MFNWHLATRFRSVTARVETVEEENDQNSAEDVTPKPVADALTRTHPPNVIDDINAPDYGVRHLVADALFHTRWRSSEICARARFAARQQEPSGVCLPQCATEVLPPIMGGLS